MPELQTPAPMPLEAVRTMSGLELLRAALAGKLPLAPMAALMNMRFAEVEEGRVVFAGTPGTQHYNPLGAVHGGYAATLLDSAMGCAVHTTLPAGVGYTTLEFKVNLVRAMSADTGEVLCEGRLVHRGRSIATAEGTLCGPDGKVIAHGSTTCMILGG
jgi:uncharacterized protein (TIGR00369 family)